MGGVHGMGGGMMQQQGMNGQLTNMNGMGHLPMAGYPNAMQHQQQQQPVRDLNGTSFTKDGRTYT